MLPIDVLITVYQCIRIYSYLENCLHVGKVKVRPGEFIQKTQKVVKIVLDINTKKSRRKLEINYVPNVERVVRSEISVVKSYPF